MSRTDGWALWRYHGANPRAQLSLRSEATSRHGPYLVRARKVN